MDISLGLKTATDASMPRKRAFTSSLEDEEHLAPKKFKYDLSPVRLGTSQLSIEAQISCCNIAGRKGARYRIQTPSDHTPVQAYGDVIEAFNTPSST